MGGYDVEYFKNNVTLDTLFDDHSVQKYKLLLTETTLIYRNLIPMQLNVQNATALMSSSCNKTKKAFSIGESCWCTILTGGVGALAGLLEKKVKSNGSAKIAIVFLKQNKQKNPSKFGDWGRIKIYGIVNLHLELFTILILSKTRNINNEKSSNILPS